MACFARIKEKSNMKMIKNIEYVVLISAVLLITRNVDAQTELEIKNIAAGEYSYNYHTYDGGFQLKSETAKHDDKGDLIVEGQYKYVVDNKRYVVSYTADKNGYHAKVTIEDYSQSAVQVSLDPGLLATLVGK
ncbi:uncharacterized protein LOC114351488 isoform X2 [Ostrinia furnacalis]|uniref:uncharacterized protein LOC114351488 isoform X2 n=1 Tax=Ostrinia furnacalis TaxID=93504 RepID=UPI00103A7DEC|nr:uncharacterized protein LOC114351488 isoform X2 [Ostrinia furnacalis]